MEKEREREQARAIENENWKREITKKNKTRRARSDSRNTVASQT